MDIAVKKCAPCNALKPHQQKEKMKIHEVPKLPWTHVSSDIFEFDLYLKLATKFNQQFNLPDLPFFGHAGHADQLELLLTKAGDVEINPGPTTLNKKVWICYICHKQIHVRKQISIRCNRIEHWVHLRCAGIHQAQYTGTWTYHLHRESRLTPHTDITTPHRSRSKSPTHSPPTPPQPNTDTCPTLPLSSQDW